MPRLLLVEDELVNRDLFRRRLERKGHTVVPAEGGLSAVALTQSEKPDLVLMDLGLPDIDGWEAMRRIKADPTTAMIPIIVLSAHATTEAREKAFTAGCEEFETKPVNWDVLFKKIDEALARAKAKAALHATAIDEIDLGAALLDPDPARTDVIRGPRPAQPSAAPAPPADAPTTKTPALPAAPAGVSTVELPAFPKYTAPPAPPKAEDKEVCEVRPKRILVVEDNDANRVMLCRRLNKHGYVTVEAADGRQALDTLARQPFDLVLCDIMMPGVDGYTVLKEMKADPDLATTPIIMISALDEMESIVRCIEMGAEDYLQKPYEPVLLHARVNACLDKRRLREQEIDYRTAVAALTRAAALVEKGAYDPAVLSVVAERDDDLGTLARVFATMAYEVAAREKQLRDDVERLTGTETDHTEEAPAPRPSAETMILPHLPPRPNAGS